MYTSQKYKYTLHGTGYAEIKVHKHQTWHVHHAVRYPRNLLGELQNIESNMPQAYIPLIGDTERS
jgi:hypothetical protein